MKNGITKSELNELKKYFCPFDAEDLKRVIQHGKNAGYSIEDIYEFICIEGHERMIDIKYMDIVNIILTRIMQNVCERICLIPYLIKFSISDVEEKMGHYISIGGVMNDWDYKILNKKNFRNYIKSLGFKKRDLDECSIYFFKLLGFDIE
jgi:hypothetical protein